MTSSTDKPSGLHYMGGVYSLAHVDYDALNIGNLVTYNEKNKHGNNISQVSRVMNVVHDPISPNDINISFGDDDDHCKKDNLAQNTVLLDTGNVLKRVPGGECTILVEVKK